MACPTSHPADVDLLYAYGHGDQNADHDLLPVRSNPNQNQAAQHRCRDEWTQPRPRHSTAAAEQARAADDGSRDGREFLTLTRCRGAGSQTDVNEPSRQACEVSRQYEHLEKM